MDKTKLLDRLGAVGDERLLLAKVLDRAGRTQNQNIPVSTDFLSPGEQVRAADLLRLAGISGYVPRAVTRGPNGGCSCFCQTGRSRRTLRRRSVFCGRRTGRRIR